MSGVDWARALNLGAPPKLAYSGAVEVDLGVGRLVFVSGCIAMDEHGKVIGVGDARAQADESFRQVGALLTAAGGDFANVVKLGVFVSDIGVMPEVRAARDALSWGVPPAILAAEVARLVHPDLQVVVDATAFMPGPST